MVHLSQNGTIGFEPWPFIGKRVPTWAADRDLAQAAVSSRLTGQQEGTTSEEVHHVPWSSSFASSHMVVALLEVCFHLLENMFIIIISPLLVLKEIYHYWTYFFFQLA